MIVVAVRFIIHRFEALLFFNLNITHPIDKEWLTKYLTK